MALLVLGGTRVGAADQAISPYRFQEIYRTSAPAVLRLRAHTARATRLGSAFLIHADGILLTSAHLLDAAHTVAIEDARGESLNVEVLGTDPRSGVALLRVPGAGQLPSLPLGRSAPLKIGDWVVGVGFDPRGMLDARAGCISAIEASGRDRAPQMVIDAATGVGGPVLDLRGRVVALALEPKGSRRARVVSVDAFAEYVRLQVAQTRGPSSVPAHKTSP